MGAHQFVLPRPTDGQVKVLDLLLEGYTNTEIGQKLFLAEDTVKTHVKKASHDVMARNRTHLAVIYTLWKFGKWDMWPKWDARRRYHSAHCAIFKDQYCDCAER